MPQVAAPRCAAADELLEVLQRAARRRGSAPRPAARARRAAARRAGPAAARVARGEQRGDQRVGARARSAGSALARAPASDRRAGAPARRRRHRARRRARRAWPARRPRAAAARGTSDISSARVVGQAQQREEVLDVRRLEVAQAAVLDERDAPARELELEQVGVVRRCASARPARAAPCPARAPPARGRTTSSACGGLVAARRRARARAARRARRAARLGKRARGLRGDRVGGVEDRLRGAVVALERDHRGVRRSGRGSRGCARAEAARKP